MEMIQWTVHNPCDIKCLQEYSTNSRWPDLDVTTQFEKQGYHGFTFKSKMKKNEHSNGMAIFSKYSAVLEADGSPMTVHTALTLINRMLTEGGDDFDGDTRPSG